MGRRAFLIELLFAMVAMGICAAICLAGFVHSDRLSQRSYAQSQSVVRVQTAVEQFKADPMAAGVSADAKTLRYYDSEWNEVDAQVEDGYRLELTSCTEEQGLYSALFCMWSEEGAALYSVETKKYLPARAREAGV